MRLYAHIRHSIVAYLRVVAHPDADELVPEDGKDEVYDNIMTEINELEDELKGELKSIRKKTGCVLHNHSG